MNKITMLVIALILGLVSTAVFATEPTPAEKRVAELEAQTNAARVAALQEKEMARAQAKAEWASKSFGEAMRIRGQNCIDASQYVGGQVSRGICNADGYVAGAIAYPSAYVMATAFSGAEVSKSYANNAWNNEETQVALKVGDKEVQVQVPETETK